MNNPAVSVIIPCFNQGHFIEETLSSFLDYPNPALYEIIIVNDGSTNEHTIAVLKKIAQQGYTVIHQDNQGLCSARNNGIAASIGRYILPLDADDKIDIQFIHEAVHVLDNDQEYAVVYSDGEYFDSRTGPWIVGPFNLQKLMIWNFIHNSAIFRRSAWEKAGGYDTRLNYLGFEDWDLWLAIAFRGGGFFYIPKQLFSYRITPNSMVRSFNGEKYEVLQKFILQKYDSYLSPDYLNDHLVLFIKRSKILWLKLFLRTYFPKYMEKLVEKGKIKSTNIF